MRIILLLVVITSRLLNIAEAYFGFPLITKPKEIWSELLMGSIHQRPEAQVFPGEQCDRSCSSREPPRICYYKWSLESYASMGSACWDCMRGNRTHCFHPQCITGNGMERGMVSINRKMPGPPIIVCRNDTIVVDVSNDMEGLSSAIHWHGFHQRETPWMDGVPMVTQCPIPPGTTFRYAFKAREAGTQWYHSHSGYQKANGHIGAAVVRNPNDINRALYDFDLSEHVLMISDWTLDSVERWVPGLQSSQMQVDSVLVNGRGRYKRIDYVPLTVFRVQPGKRYRFRLISAGSQYCPFRLQIEKHRMMVISTDGGAVKPHVVDTLISVSGERYDFVLHANQTEGNYWVRVRGIAFCNKMRIEGFAVLSYADPSIPTEDLMYPVDDPPNYDDVFPLGITLNRHTARCYTPYDNDTCAADLETHEVHRDEELIAAEPDQRLYVGFDVIESNNSLLFSQQGFVHFSTVRKAFNVIGVTNNISFTWPSFPLLIQPELITNENRQFCNDTHLPASCNGYSICICTHKVKVNLGDVVEVVLFDTALYRQDFYHPYHIHGYRFIITDMGRLPEEALDRRLDYLRENKFTHKPNSHNPPYKDTISIPNQGFVRTRFRANNPGFWLIHCHFEWHLGTGMGLVLQVGELNQLPKAPADFPRCGNFKTKLSGLD
ncbi:uncharacterized protein LOC131679093 [Topomyia yanbarensis]|uniref:uncharacterized protein LOC131679093 n=1 Tax=Topomyia yanbarensis TaxID=2498891 RepID=UPI00273BD854|nr:uncharacterized protein LOC131679093 [Topomyia yanbarensis]